MEMTLVFLLSETGVQALTDVPGRPAAGLLGTCRPFECVT